MKTIKYKIEFFSNWHCGSGLGAGADVDAIVIKDKDGIPFVPGKTVKGLLREAAMNVVSGNAEWINRVFGNFTDKDDNVMGCAFFSDAAICDKERKAICGNGLAPYLFRSFAATAIDENGIAKDLSLRKIETVVPCTLYGYVLNVPEEHEENLEKSFRYVKRMGLGRNRGYGRCEISKVE